MVADVINTCLLATVLCCISSHAQYTSELKLNFLCDSAKKTAYVRDMPWDCGSYIICVAGMAVPATCPRGKLYNSVERDGKCQPMASVDSSRCHDSIWNKISAICHFNPTAHIPVSDHCGQFYDCAAMKGSLNLVDYLVECPYPQLFCRLSGRCENYMIVECHERPEPKAPCDYFQYLQLYECPGHQCAACKRSHPSCVGLTNGHHPVPFRDDLAMECGGERTLNIQTISTASSTAMTTGEGALYVTRLGAENV